MHDRARGWHVPLAFVALAMVLAVLALIRPIDHDESQYVAAAALTAHGLLPYRDYAYLQTPLQPFAFAPIVWCAGIWAWPALRIVNALLGAGAAACVFAAARTGRATTGAALAAALLFVTCDITLFSVATARNDALPAALLAAALIPIVAGGDGRATRRSALIAGALLGAAAAAKISYALPAAAYGLHALFDRRHRPAWIALGAAPALAFVAWTAWLSPAGFWYGVFEFPMRAPGQYYRALGQPWKLGFGVKLLDILKFLALGSALPALLLATRFRWRARGGQAIDWMLVGAFVAALCPSPTWRQYLLPILPPLFVRLAIGWTIRPPRRRGRIVMAVFAVAGLAPSIAAFVDRRGSVLGAVQYGRDLGAMLDRAGVRDGIVTLSPQYLAAAGRLPDPRFATGPFHFRTIGLVPPAREAALGLVSLGTIARIGTPPAILTGGERKETAGNPALDVALDRWAMRQGYRAQDVPRSHLRLWIRPVRPPAPRNAP